MMKIKVYSVLVIFFALALPACSNSASQSMEQFNADLEHAKKHGKVISQKKGMTVNSDDPQKIAEVKEKVKEQCLAEPNVIGSCDDLIVTKNNNGSVSIQYRTQ